MLYFAAFLLLTQNPTQEPIDLAEAQAAFQLVEKLWNADQGKLWGTSLKGPMIFVEPRSRRAVANSPDGEGLLKPEGSLFVGTLPANVPVANYSVKWAGVTWIMVMWPLPRDEREKVVLLMHEPFHRAQTQLGFPPTGPRNAHLLKLEGRYWLQLEWRALQRAIEQPDKRKEALADALHFRAVRRSMFPDARIEEQQLEMHEGLANYTGYALAGMSKQDMHRKLCEDLERANERPSFTRAFAYLSGPAYGVLLDEVASDWRKKLRSSDDLGQLIRQHYQLPEESVTREKADERARQYRSAELMNQELDKQARAQGTESAYRKKFTDAPQLIIPLIRMQMTFNPNTVTPLEQMGTVYGTLKVIDAWGTLSTTRGGLISSDFKQLRVSVPLENSRQMITGDGWELELHSNWTIKRGDRQGDWILVQKNK